MVKLDQICLSPYFQTKHETFLWKLWTNVEYIFTRFRAWNIEIVRPAPPALHYLFVSFCHKQILQIHTNLVPESFANQPKMRYKIELYFLLVRLLRWKHVIKICMYRWSKSREISIEFWQFIFCRNPRNLYYRALCIVQKWHDSKKSGAVRRSNKRYLLSSIPPLYPDWDSVCQFLISYI